MAKYCENCGAALPEGTVFCARCGAVTGKESASLEPEPPESRQPAGGRRCAHCGNPLQDGEKFCAVCGTPAAAQPLQDPGPARPIDPPGQIPQTSQIPQAAQIPPTSPIPQARQSHQLPQTPQAPRKATPPKQGAGKRTALIAAIIAVAAVGIALAVVGGWVWPGWFRAKPAETPPPTTTPIQSAAATAAPEVSATPSAAPTKTPAPASTPKPSPTPAPSASPAPVSRMREIAGQYKIASLITQEDGNLTDEIREMEAMGVIAITLRLNANGTGELSFFEGDTTAISWDDTSFTIDGETISYTYLDGTLTLAEDGEVMVFVRNDSETSLVPPVSPSDHGVQAGDYDAVSCTRYGVEAELDDEYLHLEADGTGYFNLLDTHYSLTWTWDGTEFRFEDEEGDTFRGSYANGEISGDYFDGYFYVFRLRTGDGTGPFSDVSPGDWYYNAARWAAENGIVSGNALQPDQPATRAQALTFLWRAKGCPAPVLRVSPFTDTGKGEYYDEPVLWAFENGLISISSDGQFHPDSAATRAQAITFLCRAENGSGAGYREPFGDVNDADWFSDAVKWAYAEGIVSDGASFDPNGSCTRAHYITFLYRCYGQ